MNLPTVDRIVNALLYEGYVLYPYRASSVKNHHLRFNFGVVYPRAYAEAQSGHDAWTMQTQCLAAGGESASLEICVRFLRIVERNSVEDSGQIDASWQEAVECRVDLPPSSLGSLCAEPLRHEFFLPAEKEETGGVTRNRAAICGVIEARAEEIRAGVSRITVRMLNSAELTSGNIARDAALAHSLISAHTVLTIEGGEFVSLLEPPVDLRKAASQCRNEGTWPVLVGEPGDKNTVLSSPIILYDYPAVAPESPGELCDSTEIDEILTLRVLTLTDQEKNEARRTDERARRILDRAEALNPEQFSKLHGTFRGAGGSR